MSTYLSICMSATNLLFCYKTLKCKYLLPPHTHRIRENHYAYVRAVQHSCKHTHTRAHVQQHKGVCVCVHVCVSESYTCTHATSLTWAVIRKNKNTLTLIAWRSMTRGAWPCLNSTRLLPFLWPVFPSVWLQILQCITAASERREKTHASLSWISVSSPVFLLPPHIYSPPATVVYPSHLPPTTTGSTEKCIHIHPPSWCHPLIPHNSLRSSFSIVTPFSFKRLNLFFFFINNHLFWITSHNPITLTQRAY